MNKILKLAALSVSLATFVASCNTAAPTPAPSQSVDVTNGIDLDNLQSASAGSDAYKLSLAFDAQKTSLVKLSFPLIYQYVNRETSINAQSAQQSLVIDAIAIDSSAALLGQLKAIGLTNGVAFGNVVSGRLPLSALGQAATLSSLRSMRQSRARTNVGLVTSQGDKAQNSDIARATYGLTGSGVKVGVLSDSMNELFSANTTYDQDVANNDLPSSGVNILQDSFSGGEDEGRAMAQIIHDVAPGAQILFHSAFNGEANFAQGIVDLKNAGAKVIVDDVFYYDEPVFQDGLVAAAVNQVKAAGVSYFSSAGNQAADSWEGTFKPSARTLRGEVANNFASATDDNTFNITIPVGGVLLAFLNWDEPYSSSASENGDVQLTSPGASSDYNMYLTDVTGRFILPPSTVLLPVPAGIAYSVSNDNNIGSDPVEAVEYANKEGTPITVGIVITRKSGTVNRRLKLSLYDDFKSPEYPLDKPTIKGHSNAAGAFSTAAVRYSSTPAFGATGANFKPEYFTSLGGNPILFDAVGTRLAFPVLRQKPEATAPDGADTTFFYRFDNDRDGTGFPNFYGTSAAAPHAAAVAALLKQAQPNLTPDSIYNTLKATALDMSAPGYDPLTGTGLIQADKAIAASGNAIQTVDFEDVTGFTDFGGGLSAKLVATYSKFNYTFSAPTAPVQSQALVLVGPATGFGSTVGLSNYYGYPLKIVRNGGLPFNLYSFKYSSGLFIGTSLSGTATVTGTFADGTTQTLNISYPAIKTFQTLTPGWTNLVKVQIVSPAGVSNPVVDNFVLQDQ